ncbi:unnamed protein product (macronuclear) [Paramecium tetraurelia]|uniref:Uncharacterized protein n=1 Tax=Paramecium tetraurelia TaxID=5888 RepID=A0CNI3_PARTE|nr:uncharacterized protein GSPATT00008792001 [Paramecium tetraurelia]CAK72350.1 unnamed protein product [Paramecium tetraurelia]|eukprot:XP_001439747.1 hypothetical protein (macronuclear) [Paramecium tetraurelia strain d4-2]
MGQICKLPSTEESNLDTHSNDIRPLSQDQQLLQEQILSDNQFNNIPNQYSLQLSCTPEIVIPQYGQKMHSLQDSQYTPEFLGISQPFQQQVNIYQQQF